MPDKKFALEWGKPKRLLVVYARFSSHYTFYLDGELIGEIENAKDLKKGRTFSLPDGTKLNVRQKIRFGSSELQLFRNGVPLPESDADPQKQLENACYTIFLIGGLNIIGGILLLLTQTNRLGGIELDFISIIATGIIYLVLGYFVQRRSQIALGITVIGFMIDSLSILLVTTVGPGPLVARLFLLLPMIKGFSAIRAINKPPPIAADQDIAPSQYKSFLDTASDKPAVPRKAVAINSPAPVQKGMLESFTRLEMTLAAIVVVLVVLVIAVVVGAALNNRKPPVEVGILPTQMVFNTDKPTLPPEWTPTLRPTPTASLPTATSISGAAATPTSSLPTYTATPVSTTVADNRDNAKTIALETDLQKVVFDPATAMAYGLDFQNRKVWFIDLAQQTITGSVDLAGSPTDACVHPTQRRLYVVSWGSPAVTEIDLDTHQAISEIFWPATDESDGRAVWHYSIYCQPDRLLMIDAAWAPQPWEIDLTTAQRAAQKFVTQQIERESTITETGIGDMVFTSDPDEFYYWYQFGWDAGYAGSEITHARFAGDKMLNLNGAGMGPNDYRYIGRDPLDTPIFFDPDSGRIIAKRLLLNTDDLEKILYVFPEGEDIYAVDWTRNLAASKQAVYDLDSFRPVLVFEFVNPTQLYFAPDSTLYILSNSNDMLYSLTLAD